MFRRLFLLCLTVSVLFSFASCDKEHTDTSNSKVSEETLVLTYDEGAHVDINASYPVFHLENDAVNERINGVVKAYVDSLYDFYYEKKPFVATDTLYFVMRYDVTLLDENYASVHFYTLMAGGSSPQYVMDDGFTFDLATGELVSLLELYTADEIRMLIDSYFSALDESEDPALFFRYTKEDIKEDFLYRFDKASPAVTDFYNSYYITESTLYLFAGLYEDYCDDIDSDLHGKRPFTIALDIKRSSES